MSIHLAILQKIPRRSEGFPAKWRAYNSGLQVYNCTRREFMTVQAIPEGFHTLTPYFSVPEAPQFIEFLKKAFNAKDTYVVTFPDGTLLSAEVQVGDSMVIVSEADPDDPLYKAVPANVYMYVPDVDAVYRNAIKAGAKRIQEPADQFWGDRNAIVEDLAGNHWWIATHKEDISSEELVRRAMESE
jgi:PhnB protein